MTAFPYIWRWGTCPKDGHPKYPETGRRKGMRCRVIVRGAMDSALVEFADG